MAGTGQDQPGDAGHERGEEDHGRHGSVCVHAQEGLACRAEQLPWLKQWHNEYDSEMGRTLEQVRAWQPLAKKTSGKTAKTQSS